MSFPAILALEDGSIFHGEAFGVEKKAVGELVFNTSMSGYQEIMTDPSYNRQIITFTHPHIGNTGINKEDYESPTIFAEGFVIRDFCNLPSNHRSNENLETFLINNNSIAISNIDTRHLTNHLREKGALRSCIVPTSLCAENEAVALANDFEGLEGLDLAQVVSTKKNYEWSKGIWPNFSESSGKFHIVAYDYGIKKNILRLLAEHVGNVSVVNAKTPADDILQMNPDGIFLSNGPGDPEPCDYAIKNIQKFLEIKIPIFGICLGHQLLALAGGAQTEKMKFGHHGANHPVKDIKSHEVFITSQNHGFAVNENSIPENIEVSHVSLFDNSIQGISFRDRPAFSFQGHPEASPGPQEISTLFLHFKSMVEKYAKKK